MPCCGYRPVERRAKLKQRLAGVAKLPLVTIFRLRLGTQIRLEHVRWHTDTATLALTRVLWPRSVKKSVSAPRAHTVS